ncbi:MAG: DUF99 family protein [Thermoplasmatota archaeon]
MPTWPLKDQARVMGVDDGKYIRGSRWTPVVMTIMRLNGRIEGFLKGSITTDGVDSSLRIANILEKSRFRQQVRCIISDGACLGGFNVLDMDDLYNRTGIPVLTASDERPDPPSMKATLRRIFKDADERYRLVSAHRAHRVELPDGICYVREKGISRERSSQIIKRATFQGRTPEPIRISHMVASLENLDRDING